MKSVVYEVLSGKFQGKIISEVTNDTFEGIKIRASAMGWRVVTIYVS